MKKFMSTVLVVGLCSVAFTPDAQARAGFLGSVPNASSFGNCTFCHTDPAGGADKLNATFGQKVKDGGATYYDGATLKWDALGAEDFDGDGVSNNDELTADPPSDPRDGDSLPEDGAAADDASCTVTSAGSNNAEGAGAFLALLGLIGFWRRKKARFS